MKRASMPRKTPKRKPATQSTYVARPRAQPEVISDGAARAIVQCSKGPKAKPGKHAPTAEESRWMDAITAYGCIACRIDGYGFNPGAVHHILRGGQRMGHLWTICLCDPGHHQGGQEFGRVSRHPYKARFEAKYGTEGLLLLETAAAVGILPKWREGE